MFHECHKHRSGQLSYIELAVVDKYPLSGLHCLRPRSHGDWPCEPAPLQPLPSPGLPEPCTPWPSSLQSQCFFLILRTYGHFWSFLPSALLSQALPFRLLCFSGLSPTSLLLPERAVTLRLFTSQGPGAVVSATAGIFQTGLADVHFLNSAGRRVGESQRELVG